jgi:hypothetical protein
LTLLDAACIVGIIVYGIILKVHHTSPNLSSKGKVRGTALTTLAFVFSAVSTIIYASSSRADLQREYFNDQKLNQLNEDQCNRQRRRGNYTTEGGGSWSPQIFLDGNTVYRSIPSGPCNLEWQRVGTIGRQSEIDGSIYLFTKKKSDLVMLEKRACLNCDNLPPIQKTCYVPIDWSKGERKYPYCGCFDNPVPSWMSSSGYCKNVTGFSFGGFLKDLLKP